MRSLTRADCRACHTRRIRCDRSSPSCRKCIKKGIVCPQYGLELKWTNAVAVRGRLKNSRTPASSQSGSRFDGENPTVRYPDPALDHQGAVQELSHGPNDRSAEDLIGHYEQHIAPIMVWLDSATNDYKSLVSPLARNQPVLSLAIQAISAAHLMLNDNFNGYTASKLYEESVTMIASLVADFTAMQPQEDDEKSIEALLKGLLASTLVLSNHSLLFSRTQSAQVHTQAARTLLCTISTRPKLLDDDTVIFLRNQLIIYDVLACTTVWDTGQILNIVLPPSSPEKKMFLWHHLVLIHTVTVGSIQSSDQGTPNEGMMVLDYIDKFELALGQDFAGASALSRKHDGLVQRDFVHRDLARLIQIFHHAGILYTLTRLRVHGFEEAKHYHTERLFASLACFHDINMVLHNLAWPLFIAGTVSTHSTSRQDTVCRLFDILVSLTAFRHHDRTLEFLKQMWLTESNDWLDLAQCFESRGEPIVTV